MSTQASTETLVQSIADRVEIEALRAEFADAVTMNDYERLASLFLEDGALRMPDIPAELCGQEAIRAFGRDRQAAWLVQTSHPGALRVEGTPPPDARTCTSSPRHATAGSGTNFAIYHDRYQRTPGGWRFAERVYEIRYLDMTPLAGSPHAS